MVVRRISPICNYGQLQATSLNLITNQPFVYIYAGYGIDVPNLRYNKNTSRWQFSNDGTTWTNMGAATGSIGDDSVKIAELIQTQISIDTDHQLPNSNTYTMASGSKLDVYLNGQLLTHDKNNTQYDYIEVSSTIVKFHFTIVEDTILTYVIK